MPVYRHHFRRKVDKESKDRKTNNAEEIVSIMGNALPCSLIFSTVQSGWIQSSSNLSNLKQERFLRKLWKVLKEGEGDCKRVWVSLSHFESLESPSVTFSSRSHSSPNESLQVFLGNFESQHHMVHNLVKNWNFMHLRYISHLTTASREIPLQSWISEFKLGSYDITE